MRFWINADCTGEPPGELIASATALSPPTLNARAMTGASDSSDSPRRRGPNDPITPDSGMTATVGGGWITRFRSFSTSRIFLRR